MVSNPSTQLIDPLTDRELDVLRAISEGMSNQEIANHLHIALATVKWYNANIYSKLDVSNRHDAVERANHFGILSDDAPQTLETRHNLPQMSTPFIGRLAELRELQMMLHNDSTRLITITAQGGMGKTRLSIELAHNNLVHFTDGVYFVQLAPIHDSNGVITAIANALGLQHYDNTVDMQDNLIQYLRPQTILLVLDNFEHVLDAATFISEILTQAPHLKIITTSRERLKLRGEVVYTLRGLTTSDETKDEATELFIQCTRRIRPDFEITEEDAPHIAEICQLVDGLPLGIELAAGWMDTLSPEKLAAEIRSNLSILETDLRDVPDRHRSIQATFDYTWQQLTESEQATMMSLSLFRGGITQEAARAVALADIRRLKHLVNKSLLYYHDEQDRYSIHELLRQFCFDKLIELGNYDSIVNVYMTYFANYAYAQYQPMDDFYGHAFDAIRADWDNLAFAWSKMLVYERYDLLEKTYMSLFLFSSIQGHTYECVALFEPLLEKLAHIDRHADLERLYAHLTIVLGNLLFGIESTENALAVLDEGIALAEAIGKPTYHLLLAYNSRIFAAWQFTAFEESYAVANKLIDIAKTLNQHAFILNAYAMLWLYDDFTQDHAKMQESLKIVDDIWQQYCQPTDDNRAVLREVHFLRFLRFMDRQDEAIERLRIQVEMFESANWLYGISKARSQLMILAFEADHYDEYAEHALQILTWHKRYGRDWQTIGCLSGVSGYAFYYCGEYEKAVTACTFVANHPISVSMQKQEAQCMIELAREKLTSEAFEQAVEHGHTMTFQAVYDEAIAYWTHLAATGEL